MPTAKLPSLSILNFLLCGGGILSFVVLLILPNQQMLAKLDGKIERINTIVEEQKMLFPLYNELFKVAQEEISTDLPAPTPAKLQQGEVGDLSRIFKQMAAECGLELESVEADVSTLIDDSGYVRMNLRIKGGFADLRKFFIQMGQLPYLETIEQLQVQTVNNAEILELAMKLWLSQN